MKLILCSKCGDIRKLRYKVNVKCNCGESAGQYIDKKNAELSGFAIPIAFINSTFNTALGLRNINSNKSGESRGVPFTAFVIPDDSPYIKYV